MSGFKSYELTVDLLAQLSVAQHVPVEILEQLGNERLTFTAADFLHHGGYLALNGWNVEPKFTELTQAQYDAGVEAPHEAWEVQWTLSAWVNADTMQARRLSQRLDRDNMLRFSLKLRRQRYGLDELSTNSALTLNHIYHSRLSGNNVAVDALILPEFQLQFDLQAIEMKYKDGAAVYEGPRLFGDRVYCEGFRFRVPSRERGAFEAVPEARTGVEVADLMARIAAVRDQASAAPAAAVPSTEEVPF